MTGNGGMENGSAWPRTHFGSLDVLADVPHELSAQIGDGGEDATGDDVPLDPGEPQFDLVEPGRVSRREVQPDTIKRRAMGKMRAVQVAQGGGALELVEREMPEPTQGEVRVRVEACGVCHSDRLTVEGQWPGLSFPRIPGHEIAGVIDAVGAGVVGWSAGQRVGVGWFGGHCGRCEPCRRGWLIDCRNLRIPGISYDGGYADAMVAPASALAAIPDELSAVDAAPLLCAGVTTFNALRHSGAMPGDVVAVLGIGGLGHFGVQFANKLGFRTVAIARGSDKEALSRKLGAHHFIDTPPSGLISEIKVKSSRARKSRWPMAGAAQEQDGSQARRTRTRQSRGCSRRKCARRRRPPA
jgi:Zn-dependent alcohol dehydrogenase